MMANPRYDWLYFIFNLSPHHLLPLGELFGFYMSFLLLFATAFSMGLLGSPHCLGMCGGIVTAFGMSMQHQSQGKKTALIITYHLGRLLSYSLLGILAGTLGMAIFAPLMGNNVPRLALGAVLMVIGLSMLGLPFLTQLEKVGMKLWQAMSPIRKQVFPIDSLGKALLAGLLWGFLPCGLVYGALMMVVAGHDTLTGAMMMFVFGLGTLPMLLATQTTVGLLRHTIQKFKLRQINGALLMLAGVMVMVMPLLMSQMMSHNHSGSHIPATATPTTEANETHPTLPMHHDMSNMPHHHE